MIKNQTPLVSVGLPVYNEAAHIRRTLESWLAQDYADFESIISDDASTDCTVPMLNDKGKNLMLERSAMEILK